MIHYHRNSEDRGSCRSIKEVAVWFTLGILAAAGFALLFGFAVMLLWNRLMPDIFGLVQISYFQAFGLVILARLLVGGWHHGHGRSGEKYSDRDRKNKKTDEAYKRYWAEEGKEAFDEYLKKIENNNKT